MAVSGRGLYDTRIMTLPTGTFDDTHFKKEVNQPSFSITKYFIEGTKDQEVFWAPSDFDLLIYYSPSNSDGNILFKISVEKFKNEKEIR